MSWMRQKPETSSDNPNPAPASAPKAAAPAKPAAPAKAPVERGGSANIGQSVQIKGTLTGKEDLTIHGKVEGEIRLAEHALTIGANGTIDADVRAKDVYVQGQISGNIHADNKVEIAASGSVRGDIRAPRVAIVDGASFKGSVDMEKAGVVAEQPKKDDKRDGAVREMTRSGAA